LKKVSKENEVMVVTTSVFVMVHMLAVVVLCIVVMNVMVVLNHGENVMTDKENDCC
jgi:hypothetical protein